jgi:DNA-binding response OmpR family regulator
MIDAKLRDFHMTSAQDTTHFESAPRLCVLLVEDDNQLRFEIEQHLSLNGFKVHGLASAQEITGVDMFNQFDLFVIDVNLPGENGLSLSNRIRESSPSSGIVIVTARPTLSDKLASYTMGGADFHLNKPISPDELVMVLKNLGRRINKAATHSIWTLSLSERVLNDPSSSHKIRLTAREKMLLSAFTTSKDNTLSSDHLLELFTSPEGDEYMSKHALEELIARLKRKIKVAQAPDEEAAIKSVWGVGYQLCIKINIVH